MHTTKRVELFRKTLAQETMLESLCGLVSEVKDVFVMDSTEYSDYSDILASTIIDLTIYITRSRSGHCSSAKKPQ